MALFAFHGGCRRRDTTRTTPLFAADQKLNAVAVDISQDEHAQDGIILIPAPSAPKLTECAVIRRSDVGPNMATMCS
jgi:hypothetical protein